MSGLGVAPPEGGPPSAAREPGSEIPIWVLLVAGVVALSLAAFLGFAIITWGNDPPTDETTGLPKPSYPATWDPRIAP